MEDNSPFENVTFEEVADDPESPSEEEEESQPEQEEDIDQQEIRDEDTEETEEQSDSEEEQESQSEEEERETDQAEEDVQEDEEEEEESVSVIDALKKQTGFETDKDYSNDLDGASEFINDAAQQQAQEQLNQVFTQLPEDVQTYMEFRANGGEPEEFLQTYSTNWNETEIKEDNSEQHERIVRQRYREEGYSDDQIEEAIDDYKSSGVLYNEAKRSLNRLQTLEEQKQEQLVEQQQQQAQQQQEQIEEAWDEIEQTLDENNELNGLPVPESKKGEFYDWMSEPVEEVNGQPVSQRDLAAQQADVETLLTLDYVLYLMNDEDLSFSDIIDQKATSKKAEDLESLLDNSKEKKKPSDQSTGPSGDGSSSDVDTDSIPDVEQLIN